MTTEEALAVADAVQFGHYSSGRDEDSGRETAQKRGRGLKRGRGTKYLGLSNRTLTRHISGTEPHQWKTQKMRRHWEDTDKATESEFVRDGGRSGLSDKISAAPGKHKRGVHIQHVEHMHFSLEAQKARIDRAERTAMRRMIEASPLPDRTKAALLLHSKRVQFADDGKEIPSVPLKWVVQAAVWQMSLETEG